MRILRTTLAILLFLALLALLAAGSLMLYATPERLSARIGASLETHLGLRASLSGDATVKRLPELIVRLPASELLRAGDGVRVGRFASAEVELAPWSVFAASPRVNRISVSGLELDELSAEKLLTRDASPAVWNVGRLELSNASVRLAALPQIGGVEVTALDAEITGLSEAGGSVRLAGTLSAPQAPALAGGDAQGLTGALTFSGVLSRNADGSLSLAAPAAALEGISGGRSVALSASADALSGAFGGLWSADGAAVAFRAADGAELQVRMPKLTVSGGIARADDARFSAALRQGEAAWTVEGVTAFDWAYADRRIELSKLDLSTTRGGTAASRLTGTVYWSPENAEVALDGAVFGTTTRIRLERDAEGLLSGSAAFGDLPLETLRTLSPVWGAMLRNGANDLKIALSVGRMPLLAGSPAALESLTADLLRTGGVLSLAGGRASLLSGEALVAGICTDEAACRLHVDLRGGALQHAFAADAPVSGRLSGSAEFDLKIDPLAGPIGIVSGQGEATVSDGALAGLDIPGAHRILVEEAPESLPPEVVAKSSSTAFSAANVKFRMTAGEPLRLSGELRSDATAALPGWKAAFGGTLEAGEFRADLNFLLGATEGIPELPLPAQVSARAGEAPQWNVNWLAAAAPAAEARGDAALSLRRLGQKIERAVKDFWHGLEMPEMPSFEMPKMPEVEMPKFEMPDFGDFKAPWSSQEAPAEAAPAAPEAPKAPEGASSQAL